MQVVRFPNLSQEDEDIAQRIFKDVNNRLDITCLVTGFASTLLRAQLMCAMVMRSKNTNFFSILDEIKTLEKAVGFRKTSTKPATVFKHPPLKGLWHKHYFSPAFIARNIRNHFFDKNDNPKSTYNKVFEECGGNIDMLSYKLTIAAYENKARNRSLTGEFIVFHKGDQRNTYLTLGSHNQNKMIIYKQCRSCVDEFPDLANFFLIDYN